MRVSARELRRLELIGEVNGLELRKGLLQGDEVVVLCDWDCRICIIAVTESDYYPDDMAERNLRELARRHREVFDLFEKLLRYQRTLRRGEENIKPAYIAYYGGELCPNYVILVTADGMAIYGSSEYMYYLNYVGDVAEIAP